MSPRSTRIVRVPKLLTFPGRPPNWPAIVAALGVPAPTMVLTYAPGVYVQAQALTLTPDLCAHEATHLLQQGSDPAAWWERYLGDRAFRKTQEIEAYAEQVPVLRLLIGDRNALTRILASIASDLAGSTYGSVMSYLEAYELLRKM